MSTPNVQLDDLIDQAKPSGLIAFAAGILALHGLLVLAAGVQAWAALLLSGWMAYVPYALIGVGGFTLLSGYGMAKFVPRLGWTAPFASALAAALAGGWFLLSASQMLVLPGAFLAAGLAPLSLLLTLIAQPAWHKCARARKLLHKELGDDAPKGSGGGLVVAAILLVILGGAGVAVMGALSVGDPLVVGIVRRGQIHDAADRGLAMDFGFALEKRGLLPVPIPDALPADASLDAARQAARAEGAGHVLVLDLAVVEERDGVIPGTKLFAVTTRASLAGTGRGDPAATESETLEFAFEDATPRSVANDVAETWVDALTPWTLEALYGRESFAPVLEAKVPTSQLASARKLSQLQDAVAARQKRSAEWAEYCSTEADQMAALVDSESGISCLGDPCRPYSAVGVSAAGEIIIQEGSRRPVFKIPPSTRPLWTEAPERLFAVDPANPTQERELMRSGNFYDLAKVDADGKFAVVETFGSGGTEAVVTLDIATGAPADVAVLSGRQRTSWVRPGLDGGPSLVKLRRAGSGLIWADGGVDFPTLDQGYWVRTPTGDRVLGQIDDVAALYDRDADATGKLTLQGRMTAAEFDGDRLYVMDESREGCRLLTVDASTLKVKATTELDGCLKRPRRLPDGRWVGVAPLSAEGDAPGDREAVLWDPAADAWVPLTANSFDEESVFPTPDGARVVFNRRLPDWPSKFDTKLYRRQVCWAEIP